jgi:hypothetical protein
MTVFWNIASCGLIAVVRRFGSACCPHHQGDRCDYGDSAQLGNVGQLLRDYTVMIAVYGAPWGWYPPRRPVHQTL